MIQPVGHISCMWLTQVQSLASHMGCPIDTPSLVSSDPWAQSQLWPLESNQTKRTKTTSAGMMVGENKSYPLMVGLSTSLISLENNIDTSHK